MNKILVIGGGASGMMAAITAARAGADVTILEHMDRIGKKILSTGNGRCNYTNRRQEPCFYRGEDPAFALPALRRFGSKEAVAFFRELGIYPKERDGYFYPASGQASSVLDALRLELRRLKVTVVTECHVVRVQKTRAYFKVTADDAAWHADCCIFACGGLAFPKSGSDGSAFALIEKLGHTFVEIAPALTPLVAKQAFLKPAAGVRADAFVKIFVEQEMACSDRGEVQLTDYGISGIPVFQVSRYAAKALKRKQCVKAVLDFMPDLSDAEFFAEIEARFFRGDGKTAQEALIGLFSQKLIPVFLKQAGISLKTTASFVPVKKIGKLCRYIKAVTLDIVDTKGFSAAQASAGGVDTREICRETMESALVGGLYFAGEVVDIDGMCGGYNLQWAWASGYAAGLHAARGTKQLC